VHHEHHRNPTAAVLALMAALVVRDAAADAPAISRLQYAADIGANLIDATIYVARRDYVDDDLAGVRLRMQIAGLADTTILRDFHIEANGDVLFAIDTGATIAGTHYAPSDVIRLSGGLFSKAFDSVAMGIPGSVHCDGVARRGRNGPLLLSFDRTFTVSGTTVRPADVIAFNGGIFGAKVVDAQALGLKDGVNIDAIDTFGTKHYLLASFAAGGSISGIPYTSADVMQLHIDDGTWTKRFALSVFSDRWNTANLGGLAATNTDTIFENDFE
jgi:hypothetical protein